MQYLLNEWRTNALYLSLCVSMSLCWLGVRSIRWCVCESFGESKTKRIDERNPIELNLNSKFSGVAVVVDEWIEITSSTTKRFIRI